MNKIEKHFFIQAANTPLEGDLVVPEKSTSIVIFAHGSGSSRLSPRNRYVAGVLQTSGLSTLLFDLLSPEEESIDSATGELRFNIPFLSGRLGAATEWLLKDERLKTFAAGYFGASTGAAAALTAAAQRPNLIRAVVSRGGRPDLAGDFLSLLKSPVLLIVGSLDTQVIELNTKAAQLVSATHRLVLVPGASHLFEEPGTLQEVAHLATDWFVKYLS
jgi:putative phosphoribosyl transferase